MKVGSVEYLIIELPDGSPPAEALEPIRRLVSNGLVHIVDLVVVTKDASGSVTALEADESPLLESLADVDGESGGVIGTEDLAYVAAGMDLASTVVVVLWEDLWLSDLVATLSAAGGSIVECVRILQPLADAAFDDVPTNA